ncbi:MAG: 5'-methylthioadenosine/S-adenosylhomocysteine nucleosidase [bacterium]
MNWKVFLAVLTALVLLYPQVSIQSQSEPPSVAVLYAFAPEGTLLRKQMTQVVESDDIMGTVTEGTLNGVRIVLVPSGIGMTNAALATQRVIDRYHPRWMIFSGIAGGIEPTNQIGDIVVPAECVTHQFGYVGAKGFEIRSISLKGENFGVSSAAQPSFRTFKAHPKLLDVARAASTVARSNLKSVQERVPAISIGGVCASGDQFVDQVQMRDFLFATFKARIVDMETSAFLQVCNSNTVPCLANRSSSDLAGGSGSSTAVAEIRQFFQIAADNAAAMTLAELYFINLWGVR